MSSIPRGVSLRRIAAALLMVFAFAAQASHAQLEVDEISILAGVGEEGEGQGQQWFFFIEVLGSDLTSGSVVQPVGSPIDLTDEDLQGSILENTQSAGFDSFSELQQTHAAGDYTVTINGTEVVTLNWNPTAPAGLISEPSLAIDSPAEGESDVSTQPDFYYAIVCQNCNDLRIEVKNTSGTGPTFLFGELDVVSLTNPIPFSLMATAGFETELELGQARAEMLAGRVDFSDQSFDFPSALPPFEYTEGAALFTDVTFTIPEPSGTLAAVAALGTLSLLSRFRRPLSALDPDLPHAA